MSSGPESSDATQVLRRAAGGERAAVDRLLPLIYDELRELASRHMARERRRDHTLQTTALVNEAYVRLIDQKNVDVADRVHFFAIASNTIRRILVDHARTRAAAKRGGDGAWERVTIDAAERGSEGPDVLDLMALDEALTKLSGLSERAGQVVTMRYFGGLTVEQIAEALRVSPRTVADDWAMARAWLKRELRDGHPPSPGTPGAGGG